MKARDNPFRTDRILQIRYRLSGATWDELLKRCAALNYRAAVVGPFGYGKTTLLEDLGPRLEAAGFNTHFVRLDGGHGHFDPGYVEELSVCLGHRDILLFDGAEKLNSWEWRRFRRRTWRAGGLIIATHRSGQLPTLWECRTSAELLAEIAGELLGAKQETVQARAEALFRKHCGDLRSALREWYDLAAEDSEPGEHDLSDKHDCAWASLAGRSTLSISQP